MFSSLLQGRSGATSTGRNGLASSLARLADLARRVPSQCAVCRAWPAQPVCEACVNQFAQPVARCHTCAAMLPAEVAHALGSTMPQCGACVTRPPPLDACLAAVSYGYPWADLVVQFKFGAHTGWARPLALLLQSTPWVEPALDAADLVLPMPLAPKRLAERGFNQAQMLARALCPGKTTNSLLLRVKEGAAQSTLPRSERLQNLAGAFAMEPLRAEEILGKRVVLVDDVMTSGATLYAAATALRAAGAAHVTGIVLARTEHSAE